MIFPCFYPLCATGGERVDERSAVGVSQHVNALTSDSPGFRSAAQPALSSASGKEGKNIFSPLSAAGEERSASEA